MNDPEISPALALVGCGAWGKNLARNFHSLGALHTICESDPERHAALSSEYPDIAIVGQFDEMLTNDLVRQVAIAAPAFQHYPLAKAALEAGKDVFVEKPFCLHAEEGETLKKIAEANDRTLMVGHLLQYHPVICKLQEMIREGIFGRIYRITSHRLNLGKVRTEENAFWSLAPHDISVILSLFPSERPRDVQSIAEYHLREDISDCSLTKIRFPGGATAEIQVSWLHPFKEQKLCIIGEKAMAVFDDTQDWPDKLTLRRNYFESKEAEWIPIHPEEPLRLECEHFLAACSGKISPKTDADEGIRVLQILETAQASAEQNGAVLPLGN